MKKLYLLGIFLLVVGLLFAGFYSRIDAAQKTPIKVGVVLALTGPRLAAGVEEKAGALWAAEVINAAGGVKGRPLKLIFEDDIGDPKKSTFLAKKLITVDKVSALIGCTGLGSTMALNAAANELKVATINPMQADNVFPVHPAEGQKFTFATLPEARVPAILTVCFLNEYLNAKKVGILQQSGVLYDNVAAGKGWTKEVWEKYRTEIQIEKFEITDVDFTAQLLRIKAFKPEALYVVTYSGGTPPPVIARQAKQILPGVPIVFNAQTPLRKFLELADDAADDVFFVGSRLAFIEKHQSPMEKKFLQVVEAHEPGFFPSDYVLATWDGVHLLARAMETAGDDPIKIRDELEKISNFKGLAGVYNLSAKDHYGHWMKSWSDATLYTLKLKPYGVKECIIFTPKIEYTPFSEVWQTSWPFKK